MTMKLCSPYDVLVTCSQDDMVKVKMKADPAAKKILEKLSAYGNMSLLPVVAELTQKIDKLEKKIDGF